MNEQKSESGAQHRKASAARHRERKKVAKQGNKGGIANCR
jgi:hypothetical protein